MNNLPLDIKFYIVGWIFKSDTIQYLYANKYNFKPNLHKLTLSTLIDNNHEVFYDLISNGLYDDNYYWTHKFKYRFNGKTMCEHVDLLFEMASKSIKKQKYFYGLTKSSKKNINLINRKKNTIALQYYICSNYSESFVCDLIEKNYSDDFGPNVIIGKKGTKCLEVCWKNKYDKLLSIILKSTKISNVYACDNDGDINNGDIGDIRDIGDNDINNVSKSKKILNIHKYNKISNFLVEKIKNCNPTQLQKYFYESLPRIYQIIPFNNYSINETNVMFYLCATKNYCPQDYKNLLNCNYLYEYAKKRIYLVSLYLTSNSNVNTMSRILSNVQCEQYGQYGKCEQCNIVDIFQNYKNIVINVCADDIIESGLIYDYVDDIIESGLIKSYDNLNDYSKRDQNLFIAIKTIMHEFGLDDILLNVSHDEFKKKVSDIMPDITNLLNYQTYQFKIILNLIKNKDQELIIKFINFIKPSIQIPSTFKDIDPNYLSVIYNKLNINKTKFYSNFIVELIEHEFDKVIIHLINQNFINPLGIKYQLYGNDTYNEIYNDCHYEDNTFLELFFIKNKTDMAMKIFFDNKSLLKKKYVTNIFCKQMFYLSCKHSNTDFCCDLILKYYSDEWFSTIFYQTGDTAQTPVSYIMINKMDKVLDIVMSKLFTKITSYTSTFSLNKHFSIVNNKNKQSLISLLIKYDYTKYLEQLINLMGKNIFSYVKNFNKICTNFYPHPFNSWDDHKMSDGLELYWACKKNLNNIAWFFVSNKLCKLDYVDDDGNTCLILACVNKMETVAGHILYSGLANYKKKNKLGLTAMNYAKQNNMIKICEIINIMSGTVT